MIAFTLCSNNYLSKARVLARTFLEHNPDAQMVIVIVDRRHDAIDYPATDRLCTMFVEELEIPEFAEMSKRYSIIELNTAIKPFIFRHILLRTPPSDGIVLYLDPDIKVFAPFTAIREALQTASIVVTPHIISPIPVDGRWPAERAFLNYGLYNLGFLALRASESSRAFVDWWSERLFDQCFDDVQNGLFVDQLWINYAPIFFDVHVSHHVGMNAAYWNLHERVITLKSNGMWVVNSNVPLVFYHFSSFSLTPTEVIGRKAQTRYTMSERPNMRPLFEDYRQELLAAGALETMEIPCAFKPAQKKLPLSHRVRRKLTRIVGVKEPPRPPPGQIKSR